MRARITCHYQHYNLLPYTHAFDMCSLHCGTHIFQYLHTNLHVWLLFAMCFGVHFSRCHCCWSRVISHTYVVVLVGGWIHNGTLCGSPLGVLTLTPRISTRRCICMIYANSSAIGPEYSLTRICFDFDINTSTYPRSTGGHIWHIIAAPNFCRVILVVVEAISREGTGTIAYEM